MGYFLGTKTEVSQIVNLLSLDLLIGERKVGIRITGDRNRSKE